ncbi:2-keto-4-pentenoate hydratase [Nocardioides sp. Bht2]|uniref:2-keto-4-pentenoate hydratase n=1 Tax=Nocardioides sp. Bht2 TaxID=3392297 RepID=UPI0039B42980
MTPHDAEAALREARGRRQTLARFSDTYPELDEAWGYAVQELDRAARLRDGELITGAKLGLTSRAKQERMSVDRPIAGFLTDAMTVAADEVATRLSSWAQPRIEPEIAFITGRDLNHAVGLAEVGDYVRSVLLAAEILDSRYTGYRFRLPDVIADNTSSAGVVLAPERYRLDALPELASLACKVRVDGAVVHQATGAAILGNPLQSLVLLSEHLERHHETLPAGSLVLAGALTDATPIAPGHRYELVIEHLGELTIHV